MNKTEIVSLVADKLNLTKKVTEDFVNTFLSTVQETLENGEKVVLSGFGTFEVRTRVGRKGKNPRSGAVMDIAPQNTPAFRAGKVLKDSVK